MEAIICGLPEYRQRPLPQFLPLQNSTHRSAHTQRDTLLMLPYLAPAFILFSTADGPDTFMAFLLDWFQLQTFVIFRMGGYKMAKNSKRRAWTSVQVRELKTLAKKKTPAARIAKTLKRTVGATRQKAFSMGLSLDSRA
jgi:predicted permease